jgi:hypothetical protein
LPRGASPDRVPAGFGRAFGRAFFGFFVTARPGLARLIPALPFDPD